MGMVRMCFYFGVDNRGGNNESHWKYPCRGGKHGHTEKYLHKGGSRENNAKYPRRGGTHGHSEKHLHRDGNHGNSGKHPRIGRKY